MDRDELIEQALDEITSHDPGKAFRNARHWPGGRLSMVHVNVLFILDAESPLPMRGLAEAMDVSQASATGIVDRMEQRGLVERLRDGEDRRVIRVAPTAEGRKLVADMATQRRDHIAQLLREMTDQELDAFLVGSRALGRARDRWIARTQSDQPGGHPPQPPPQPPPAHPMPKTRPDSQEAPR